MKQAIGQISIAGKTFRIIFQSEGAEQHSLLRNSQQEFKKGKYNFVGRG